MEQLTVKEVSVRLDVALPTVYSWINKNLLKKVKTVKGIRIEEEELERFIKEKCE